MAADTKESYQKQLRLLGKAEEDIRNLNRELTAALKNYKNILRIAADSGFMQEYIDTLNVKYEEFALIVSEAKKRLGLHERHISRMREEIIRLRGAAKSS